MRHKLIIIGLLFSLAVARPPRRSAAPPAIGATHNQASLEFPDRITFSVRLQGEAEINRIVLEYGVEQLTCGTVVAKAFPEFTPSRDVSTEWTWEMKQSGSEPPGSKIWWQWRVSDAAEDERVTERQTIIWLDDQHRWQTVSGGALNLHWYLGGRAFGRDLHAAALKALTDLAQSTGLEPEGAIDLYIYADTQDMRDAVFYEPGWTGGLAYPEHNIVIIGIAPDQVEWGKRTEAHELTHVLVGHLTFSCLGGLPTWLNEGLAVYGEGGPERESLHQLESAVADDTLISVRSLSGNFSEDPAQADLSYSESYSLVNFLIEAYGRDKMLALLAALRDGSALDAAMRATYGFDIEGFEDAWRAKIGARPRSTAGATATPTPLATPVPTFVPVSGVPLSPTPSPTSPAPTAPAVAAVPTNASAATARPASAREDKGAVPMMVVSLALVCAALSSVLAVGLAVILAAWRRPRRPG